MFASSSLVIFFASFFFYCYGAHLVLHSFPTRRSSDLPWCRAAHPRRFRRVRDATGMECAQRLFSGTVRFDPRVQDRKSTRLNSSHVAISYAVFCLKKKKKRDKATEQRENSTTQEKQR